MCGLARGTYVTLFLCGKVHGRWTHDRGEGGWWSFRTRGKIAVMRIPSRSRTTKYEYGVAQWLVRTASVLLMVVINSRNAYVTPGECVHACL